MSQKLPVNNFEWTKNTSQFNEDFIQNYNEKSNKGYLEILHKLHNDLSFLPERIKIKNVKKLVVNLHDRTVFVTHIRKLKQALNHKLV